MKRNFKLLAAVLVLVVMVFTLASCELIQGVIDKFNPHEHEYSADWSSDETNHWHAAVCDKNDECSYATADLAAHTFAEGACSVCGYEDPNYVPEVPECTEHAYSIEVTKEATCTEAGEKTLTCTLCGATDVQEIAPNGHTEETVAGKAPTCTEAGLSNGKKCSVCGETTKAQSEIVATGHKFVEGVCANGCGTADPDYNGPKTYVFETNTVVIYNEDGSQNITDKAELPTDVKYVNGYFSIIGSVTQRIKNDAVYCVEVNKQDKGGIQFTVTGTAEVAINFHSTGGSNTSWIGLRDADGNLIANKEGVNTVTGTGDGLTVTYSLTAGTYTVVSPALTDEEGKDPYNRTARVYSITVTETPAEEGPATEGSINVTTTDNNCFADKVTFTATESGKYTFTVPVGVGAVDAYGYDNNPWNTTPYFDPMDPRVEPEELLLPHSFSVDIAAGDTYEFYISAPLKNETYFITWTFEPGEVDPDVPGPDVPVENDTELELGSNTINVPNGSFGQTLDCTFVADKDGEYTFAASGLMATIVIDDETSYNGKATLTAGTYKVVITYYSMGGVEVLNISYTDPSAVVEPDGTQLNPYPIEGSSAVADGDANNMIWYTFTAEVDGYVTFTYPTANSWLFFNDLTDSSNNTSGSQTDVCKFPVIAGHQYVVGLGVWNAEETDPTVSVVIGACEHNWSEATCETLSTCANCGLTTGDFADHIPNTENPTCSNPAVCTVCGAEVGYIPHSWNEGEITVQPDCITGTDGLIIYTCTVCGETMEDTIWVTHDWIVDEKIDATCTTDGYYKAHCFVCGAVEERTDEAQGHYNWWASCGETATCMECSEEFTVEHDFTFSPATCTEPAYCMNCWSYVGEPAGHKYDETGLCTECYLTHTLILAGNSAFFGTEWKLEDENNFLDYDYENYVFTKTYISVATGYHQFKVVDVTNGSSWDNCWPSQNFWFYANVGDEVVITFDLKTKNLICTVNGVASNNEFYLVAGDAGLCGEGWKLEAYSNILTLNADGKYEIVYTNVAAGSYGLKVVKNFSWDTQWGDNGNNYMINVATAGSTVTIIFDPATGISHNVKAPHVHSYFYPCDKVCQECFEESNPDAAHTVVHVEAKAATCTVNGNVEYWYCSDCGYAWADEALTQVTNQMSVVIPAAHVYTYACDKICAVCLELTNEDAAHTVVHVDAKAATCTVNGNVEYWYCSDCGYAWADEALTQVTNQMSIVVPSNGHADDNGDFKCDACSTKMLPADGEALTIPQALAIAKLHGHNTYTTQKYYITGIVTNVYNIEYGNLYLKDAEGNQICIYGLYTWNKAIRYDKMDYKPVEGDELTVYTVLGMYNTTAQGKDAWVDEVVAHEHDYETNVTEPTCTKGGYTTYTCTICEGYYTDNETVATGHSTENGTCEFCGQTIGGDAPVYESFKADFNTVSATNTSYVKSTTTSGWVATNCAVVKGGTSNSSPAFIALGDATERGFVMNGKTSAKGSIVSSTISGGISQLSLNYANVFSESNGVDITITIKQNGSVVATKKVDNNSVTQYNAYEVIWDLAAEGVAVTGDFTIEITNNSPTNSSSNKDRVAIWNVQWINNPTA